MGAPWPMPQPEMLPPPGWFPDPSGAPALRYWDGRNWTNDRAVPQLSSEQREPFTSLPMVAAITALVVTIVSLTLSRYAVEWLVEYRWPIAVYIVIAGVVGYGPLVVCCRLIVNKWGTGSFRDDLGFRFRPVDLGWGPLTWVACFGAQIVVAIVIVALDIPLVSNTEGISRLSGNRAYIISFAILAVVAAPIVEELVFRGVVLRGFSSRMPIWSSVTVQGILFGAAHIDPIRGAGNIGLVMILSAVGIVLGGSAYLVRRLAPTMISHAITNTIAVIFTLTR